MNLQGERLIPAAPEDTWAALNDPETLKACIAGCESLERIADDQYLATMALRIGPVNARFKGRLELQNIVPIRSYSIVFDGQGGVAGFGKGSADVTLTPDDNGTLLGYTAKAQVGGKLAQVGSRLIDAAAGKIAEDFFKAFEARLAPPPETGTPAGDDAKSAAGGPAASAGAGGGPAGGGGPGMAGRSQHPAAGAAAGSASRSNRWLIWGIVIGAALALLFYLLD